MVIFILIFIISSFAYIRVKPVIIETTSECESGYWEVESKKRVVVRVKKEPEVKWLKIENEEIVVDGFKRIGYKIDDSNVNKEEFVEVFFIPESEGNIITRIGSGFYLWPKGLKPKPKLEIELNIKDNMLFVNVENKGNIHLRPQFFIDIFGGRRKIFSSSTKLGIPVLVGERKRYVFDKKVKDLREGKYRVILKMNYGVPYGFKNVVKRKKFKLLRKKGKYKIYSLWLF
ncbi:MAG: hypothetical protein DRI36_01095 [Caldiserica bacterium]|nr:MAG: hypothetical protein DRI36_01095 [Caldisericota bacterium]